jgi:hypothetical protein
MFIQSKCEELEINEGNLYPEEREHLQRISSKELFDLLGENASRPTNCSGNQNLENEPQDLNE